MDQFKSSCKFFLSIVKQQGKHVLLLNKQGCHTIRGVKKGDAVTVEDQLLKDGTSTRDSGTQIWRK